MQNLFDTDNYPATEPTELVAGALWAWTRPDITEAYPTADYTLKYRLSLQISPFTVINITAAKTGDAHTVQETSTGTNPAGEYAWQAVLVRDSDDAEVVVDTGLLTVLPAVSGGVDTSSWVYQVLTAIRATLKGTASKEQQEFEIAGRRIVSRSINELLDLEKEFARRWRQERQEIDRKNGRKGRRVLVGMSA